MNGFIQLNRDEREIELFKQRPSAFMLLAIISIRAKRQLDHPDKRLQMGEAYIGDWENYCSSEQVYRTDKKFLIFHEKLTCRTTNRGTIARIVSTSPFNINSEEITDKLTVISQTANGQLTTNKKDKKKKIIQEMSKSSLPNAETTPPMMLSPVEIFEVAVDTRIWIVEVVKKYLDIREMIKDKNGGFSTRYGTNLKSILKRWLQLDVGRHIVETVDPLMMGPMQSYNPIRKNSWFYKRFEKHLSEMNYVKHS